MIGMIFAAGLGSRLKPLTDNLPKALVVVDGMTLLERGIKKLIAEGFNEIVVNVHHFADKIVDYLTENDFFGVNIHISDESGRLMNTGGAVTHAKHFFSGADDILIYNVDVISDICLHDLYNNHVESCNDVTLAVRKRSSERQLLFNDLGLMKGWRNVKTGDFKPNGIKVEGFYEYAFSGVQVFSCKLIDLMETDVAFSIMEFYIAICDRMKIGFYDHSDGFWFDIGSVEKLNSYLSNRC